MEDPQQAERIQQLLGAVRDCTLTVSNLPGFGRLEQGLVPGTFALNTLGLLRFPPSSPSTTCTKEGPPAMMRSCKWLRALGCSVSVF